MPFLRTSGEGLLLFLHVQPGASRTSVVGLHGDRLKLKIKAPPVDGAANEEVVRFMAELLGLSARDVVLQSGLSSRQKTLRLNVDAARAAEIRAKLG